MNIDATTFATQLDLRGPVTPQVFRTLRQAIVELSLKPGQSLSEKEIALALGVSRTPVREALIQLREIGLVEILPQRGTFVVPISVKAVLSARFIREAVEVAVIREAAGLDETEFVASCRDLIVRQRAAADRDDYDGFLILDEAFHRNFAVAIGRQRAWTIVEAEKAQMDRVRYLSLPKASPMPRLIAQHEAILRAVEKHDVAAAEAAMRVHLSEVLSAIGPIAEAHPELFEA